MKIKNWVLGAAFCIASVSGVSADTSVGFGASQVGGDGIDFTGVGLDVSGKFSDNFGYAVSGQIGGSDEGVDLDYFLAAKLRGGLSVGEGFLFLTAGYADVSLSGFGLDVSESDFLYGIGFESFFGPDNKWGLGLEFNTGAGDFDEVDQFSAMIKYRF